MDIKSKNEEFEEKICKKISQLTRVIFYLNVKNEEQDSLVREMMAEFQAELDRVVDEANTAIEKKNQKNVIFEKMEEMAQVLNKLEENIMRENSENLGLIRTLEKEVHETNYLSEIETVLDKQRSEMSEFEEQVRNFHSILQNKDELLDQKIKIKEEQFEKYIQENNRKYQMWVVAQP